MLGRQIAVLAVLAVFALVAKGSGAAWLIGEQWLPLLEQRVGLVQVLI